MSDTPKPVIPQTCSVCGTKWAADKPLPCPTCKPSKWEEFKQGIGTALGEASENR